MHSRRIFLSATGATLAGFTPGTTSLWAAMTSERFSAAEQILAKAAQTGLIRSAAMLVRIGEEEQVASFGAAKSAEAIFLLASITKPMCVASMLTLMDRGEFRLEDPVGKFIPEFRGGARGAMRIRHLLTHTCGLPDQLPQNQQLRKSHAPLAAFIQGAIKTPLLFAPRQRYQYSSMGILLAAEIAQRISGSTIHEWMDEALFKPLAMTRSALGLGRFKLEDVERCQTEKAAPESGSGATAATDWDWNSPYWRKFGAPWGGAHGTVGDVARFLDEFLPAEGERGKVLQAATAQLMTTNQNPPQQRPRGLGFGVGEMSGSPGCSARTFGHTGSTGTLAWADPARKRMCIVLTTLPGRAVKPHPRKLVSDIVARS